MAIVDYTSWTEEDPGSQVAVLANKITVDDFNRIEKTWVVLDKTASPVDGNFIHRFKSIYTTGTGTPGANAIWHPWAMSGILGDEKYQQDNLDDHILLRYIDGPVPDTRMQFVTREGGATDVVDDFTNPVIDTLYYYTVIRDEALGDNGRITVTIATGDYAEDGGTLIDTLVIDQTTKIDYNYVYSTLSRDDDSNPIAKIDGYVEDTDLEVEIVEEGAGLVFITPFNFVTRIRKKT